MDGQEVVIRALFSEQHCRRCGHRYQPETLLILERRSEVCVIIIPCIICQQSDTFILHFQRSSQGPGLLTGYRLYKPLPTSGFSELPETPMPGTQPLEIPETPRPIQPVTTSDVEEIQRFLQGFDGNFHNLFTLHDER